MPRFEGFHAEEYKCLRAEVELHAAQINRLGIYIPAALGLFYTFVWGKETNLKDSTFLLLAVPAVIVVTGLCWIVGINAHLRRLGSYIYRLEEYFSRGDDATPPPGWEHVLREKKFNPIEIVAGLAWPLILLAIVLLAAWRSRGQG